MREMRKEDGRGKIEDRRLQMKQDANEIEAISREPGKRNHMTERIKSVRDLIVYNKAFDSAMEIYEISKTFPKEEQYSLTDQIRRSSRSVCANISEAWRKRKYKADLSIN